MASNQTSTILLRGGTVLVHEGNKVNALPEYDVLIEGGRISQIGQELDVPEGGTVLSCYHKIVSPGFIDTHHHLWQSQLKGRHGDQSFMAYMVAGNFQSYNYTSDDIFWGQLAGSLESIDGGVTTVVDHAHMTYSPEHATAAIRATASSGLRSVFCYSLISRFKDWTESTIEIDEEKIPDWWAQTLSSLAQLQPFGEGRVSLGLGFDVFSLPKEKIINLYKTARNLGVKLITSHYVAGRIPDIPQFLAENGILGKDVLLSHACGISEMNATLLQQNEAYVSSTPDTELQMGVGEPIAFRDDIKPIASIGVDCHANNSSDILTQIRISLQHARGTHNASASQARQYPSIQIKLEEAFNLGTIQGAKAINQEHEIGSIEIGKRADIVIFDTRSPSMVCAAEENPLAAIILHASVRDIDTVIIDGKIRKQAGRLADTELYNQLNESSGEIVSWEQVVDHLLKSRVHIKEKGEDQNIQLGMGAQLSSVFTNPLGGTDGQHPELEAHARSKSPPVTGTGTLNDPFLLSIDCSRVMEVCEAQCVAILCFDAPRTMSYKGLNTSEGQRALSGALNTPFKANGGSPLITSQGAISGTVQMPSCHQDWTSPEDTTVASSNEGGVGTLIAPVDSYRNSLEGSMFCGQLRNAGRAGGAEPDEIFQKKYLSPGPYCSQLMTDDTDKRICAAGLLKPDDPVHFIYRRTTEKLPSGAWIWLKVTYPTMRFDKHFTW